MQNIEYRELKHGPINPNRARWYALGLSFVGALFAFLTIKTNWDYFGQYYEGFAFWARVIPFFGVEAAIVALPIFKGFGNKAQGNTALVFEVLLIAGALTHTYLVSDASISKIQAGKTKAEASADFEKNQSVADKITANNQKLQENYTRQMRFWNDAAYVARREGRSAPPPPQAPKLQDVPQVSQQVVDNSMMSVEQAGESRVSHQTLQRLLFALIGLVTISVTAMVLLADGSRIKAWLLSERAERIKTETTGATKPLWNPFQQTAPRSSPQMSPAPAQASDRKPTPGK